MMETRSMSSARCNQYQPSKCWKNGVENPGCCGDCSKCGIGAYENVPSVGQMVELYGRYAAQSTSVKPGTAKNNISKWKTFLRIGEIDPGMKVTQIDEQVLTRFVHNATGKMQPVSVKGILEGIGCIFSRPARRFFDGLGLETGKVPTIDYKVSIKKWVSFSREQRQKIREYQLALYDLADPRKFLAVTAAWERGMRKSDVMRCHWSVNFEERNGYVWWVYDAVKNGKHSEWPVDPDTWMMIRRARAKLDALSLQRLRKHPDSYLRVRDFGRNENVQSAVWNECGKDLRGIMGWNGSKAMHNLRKDGTDQVFQNLGIDEACEFSSDTEKKVREYYSGKKRIDPRTISIAKM